MFSLLKCENFREISLIPLLLILRNVTCSVMVVVALSVHSLFEGMAIGLEESSSGVWTLMLAISIHAVPIVFCVGTDMISSGLKKVEYFQIIFQ